MTVSQIETGIRQLELRDQLRLLTWFMQYIRRQVLSLISTTDKEKASVSEPLIHKSDDVDDDLFLSLFDGQDRFTSHVEIVDNVNHTTVEAVDSSQSQFLDDDPIIGMFSGPATLSQDVKKIVQQGLVEGSGLTWKE